MGERDGVFAGEVFDGALVDRIALGSLMGLVPPDLVDETVAAEGRVEKRKRRLPARVVVYFVLGLCLFFGDDYSEVMRKLVGSLKRMGSWDDDWDFPSTGSLSKARARLGEEPLKRLFHSVAGPLASPGMRGGFLQGYRLMAVDGTFVSLPDTEQNGEAFGYGQKGQQRSAFPRLRVVGLAECGTHAFIDAAFGASGTSEHELALRLAGSVEPGMLVILDAQSWGPRVWEAFTGRGADVLWRVGPHHRLPVLRTLPDGSWLSVLTSLEGRQNFHRRLAAGTIDLDDLDSLDEYGWLVRVVEYTVENGDEQETIRLICSITDPAIVTAVELATAYHERWECEGAIKEFKTHQKGPYLLLRSKSPAMVKQEFWALLLTHYMIRAKMAEAAETADVDPDRLSFIKAIRIIRRQITDQAGFSP